MDQSFFKTACIILLVAAGLSGCTFLGFRVGPSGGSGTRGEQGRGSIFKSINKGDTFAEKIKINEKRTLSGITVAQLQFDPQDSLTLYLLARKKGLWVSYNGAETWERLIIAPIDAFALDPTKRGVIYTAQKEQIFKSAGGGSVWTKIFSENSCNPITALAVNPSASSHLYAATKNGIVFESNDQGASWRVLKKLKARTVNGIIINPKNAREMYLTTRLEGIFKSTDYGANWGILLGLKTFKGSENLGAFKLNPQNPAHLFAGTMRGFFISKDGGGTWTALKLLTGTQSTKITAVGFNPFNERELYYAVENALYKTIDSGGSWSILELPAARPAVEILVDDFDTNIMYIGVGSES